MNNIISSTIIDACEAMSYGVPSAPSYAAAYPVGTLGSSHEELVMVSLEKV